MQKWSLSDIVEITEAKAFGKTGIFFTNIATDSRNISRFNDLLFIAVKGTNNNGHKFIKELYSKGVRSFIISEEQDYSKFPEAGFLLVENPVRALQKIAAHKRSLYKNPVIAITGSNGKTIVKEWLYHILSPDYKIIRSPKSYNSQIGVPLSLWLLDEDESDFAIIEAGISMPGEMDALESIIKPDIAIIINVGEAHSANFEFYEQLAKEKSILLRNAETKIIDADNDAVFNHFNGENATGLFTISSKFDANIFVKGILNHGDSTAISIMYQNNSFNVVIPFTDNGSIQNAIACFAVIAALNLGRNDMFSSRYASLPGVKMRLETIEGVHNSIIINDSYNSDINSLTIALDYLNQKKAGKETMLILSDILQSGDNEEELCLRISSILKEKKIKYFVGIGKMLGHNRQFFPAGSNFYNDTETFLEKTSLSKFYDKAVLIKGARNFKFEKISQRLQFKNHLSVIETDLNLMRHNLNYFKAKVGTETKMMVMVKAFSYGSGYREIAGFLQHNRIDYLAVAFTDEGVELRNHGIETPIMVMNPNIHSLQSMIEFKLEPEIYSISILKELVKELNESGIDDFPVHIKLDTGMHRLGMNTDELIEMCKLIISSNKIKIASVFTHLSGSDSKTFDSFTHLQASEFEKMYSQICEIIGYNPDRHILNSAGILRFPEYKFEMVRLGIGLYGLMPELCNELVPVSVFKSAISQIHKVKQGETVSYNRSGKIEKDSIIATIPVGYADGFDRRLGNGNWHFIINGKKAKVIGDVCMDMCMADISGISACEGDDVIIFGPENSVAKMSAVLKTIPYEIITGISQRVKRVYFEE
jgi:alanine racemase